MSSNGVPAGVANCGQSRVFQRRWRLGAWGALADDITITKAQKGINSPLTLRTQVTGVEVTAHNIVAAHGSLELYKGILPVGLQKIPFNQPMHDLSITGASITEAGANYALVNVVTAGMVALTGLVYIDTQQTYSVYTAGLDINTKTNVLTITDATLVNSTNGAETVQRVYNYYQQRLLQIMRLYAPVAATGGIVIVDTLYNQKMRGVIEKMSINLSGGFIADTEICGVVSS